MSAGSTLPRIAITVGDVAGIGPEIALQCAVLPQVTKRCEPVLYGPRNVLARIAAAAGWNNLPTVLDVGTLNADQVHPGRFDAATGRASFAAVDRAISDTVDRNVDAIVTGPIQKEAWHAAGIAFPGHTELLAERTGSRNVSMMLTSSEVSCVLVTIHIPLADVPRQLNQPAVLRAIQHAADFARQRYGRSPTVTVCGLNPHAGENGLFSHGEEAEIIQPAIDQARQQGIRVSGPVSPDTAFTAASRKATDVYVCMYHDQGLIPLKTLSFDEAVNVTLGLPIIRTSVDHGTALDLAWQGTASHRSMLAAIELAIDLSRDRSS